MVNKMIYPDTSRELMSQFGLQNGDLAMVAHITRKRVGNPEEFICGAYVGKIVEENRQDKQGFCLHCVSILHSPWSSWNKSGLILPHIEAKLMEWFSIDRLRGARYEDLEIYSKEDISFRLNEDKAMKYYARLYN